MDDKYRLFVPFEKIPETAKQALLLYEDRGFYYHPGVNPLSIGRALWDMAGGGRERGEAAATEEPQQLRCSWPVSFITSIPPK